MKRPYILRIAAAGLLAAGLFAPADSPRADTKPPPELEPRTIDSSKITWLNVEDGVLYSKTEDKHVLLDFTAVWCGWCKRMDRTTFADTSVISYVNDHFIPVKVWGDTDSIVTIEGYQITQRQLARQEFGVTGFPAFWFLSPDGLKIGPLRGYKGVDDFMRALTYIQNREYDTTRAPQEPEQP